MLSETDREALALAFARSTRSPHHLAFLAEPVVEQIVARHVTAALEAAATAIEAEGETGHCTCEYCATLREAAAVVRAATPKPPEVVSRPQPRGSGE